MEKNEAVKHSAGGEGIVTGVNLKGIYVAFNGPEHGSNFFEVGRYCDQCKIVFPTEGIKLLHIAASHKRDYPYRGPR